MTPEVAPPHRQISPGLKFALDIGPLAIFLLAYFKSDWFAPLLVRLLPATLVGGEQAGPFIATVLFIPATIVALLVSYIITRRLPIMPLVTAVVVTVFGGLTLALHDESFIKMKPTIVYLLFAATLLGGLLFRKPLLGMVFDAVFKLTDEGWRKLTLRWGLFFLVMAVLNEIVWRTQTTSFWFAFKGFGFIPLTFIFALLQFPLLQKYSVDSEEKPSS